MSYKLIALDDYIKDLWSSNISGCLGNPKPIPTVDELNSPNTRDLYNWFWARAYNEGSNEGFAKATGEYGNDKGDYSHLGKRPDAISTLWGGVCKDKVGNTIIIGNSYWNTFFRDFLQSGIYGNKIHTRTHLATLWSPVDRKDNIEYYKRNLDKELKSAFPNEYNVKKINTPLVFNITFDNRAIKLNANDIKIIKGALYVIAAAASLIPGIGTATAAAIATACGAIGELVNEYEKGNVSSSTLTNAITKSVGIFGVNTDSGIIKDGLDIYAAINDPNVDNITNAAAKLGIDVSNYKNYVDKYKEFKEITKTNDYSGVSSNPVVKYRLYSKQIEAYNNTETLAKFNYNPDEALNIIKYELTNNPEGGDLLRALTQVAVGRANNTNYMNFSVVNVFGRLDNLASILSSNKYFQTPETFKLLMDITCGGQIDNNALNYLYLQQVENLVRNSKTKNIYLPYAIPPDKAVCIAKELNTNGYNIYFDGGSVVNTRSSTVVNIDLSKSTPLTNNYYMEAV